MATPSQRVPLQMDQPHPPNPSSGASITDAAGHASPTENNPSETPVDVNLLKDQILAALRTCFDPEIPVNIYELGLIYDVEVEPTGDVRVVMTLTSPACPAAGSLPPEVQAKVSSVPGVTSAKVDVVWDPPWNQDRMSEAAKLQLGLF